MRTLNIYELPPEKRQKALEIAARLTNSPNLYTSFNGKRLNCDRTIISVPLNGGSFRLLFRDHGKTMDFCGAATHAQYDHLIGSKNCASIRPMEILAAQPKPEQTPAPIVEPTSSETARESRNHRGMLNARDYVRKLEQGRTLTAHNLSKDFEVARNSARNVILEAHQAGLLEFAGTVLHHRVYRRTPLPHGAPVPALAQRQPDPERESGPPPLAEVSGPVAPVRGPAQIAAEIASLVQELVGQFKPFTLEGFSDDDLTLEIHRRMSVRKAA